MHVLEAGKVIWASGNGRDVPDLRCDPSHLDNEELEEWTAVSMRRDDLTLDVDASAGTPW